MRKYGIALFMVAAGLGLRPPAMAVPLQSDDFKNGLQPFWKVHQILRDTDAGTYGPSKAEAGGGTLKLTSESDDIWFGTFQPFLVYQDNVTGAFDVRIKAISHNGSDSWSGAGGLMIIQNVPDMVIEADPTTYPSHWMVDASNGHGPEDKGGGLALSRENELLDLGEGTPLQAPYVLRMLRIGNSLWRYHSTDDGKTWVSDGPRVDLAHIRSWTADNVKPIKDPVAVGVVQQAHDGPGTPVTAVLGPFQATTIPTGTLTGLLCDLNAQPLPNTSVRFVVTSSTDNVLPVGTTIPIRTDDKGEISEELAPGAYDVLGDAGGRAVAGSPLKVTVTAGQPIDVGIMFLGDPPPFFEATTANSRVQDEFAGSALNSMWTNTDIGTASGSNGKATVSNGVLNVSAGGRGVRTDHPEIGFNGTFVKASGDFAATVQVLAVPDTNDNELGGLVAITSTDQFSAFGLNMITPRHPITEWSRSVRGANPLALQVANTQGSAVLPVWLKIRRVGDTVSYWWMKDPTQGAPTLIGVEQLDDFSAKDLMVGIVASAGVKDDSTDTGFKFAHFSLAPLGN
jgi:hypothetical protein